MNEYGMTPMTMLSLLGPLMVIGPLVIWFVVIGPLLLYPLARWKAHREQVGDPQLGIKVALQYFALLAFQLVLFAAAFIIYTVFSKNQEKGELYRMGFGFLIPAGIVLFAHIMLLRRTNQDYFPGVRRLFLGYNLLITGLLGFFALLFAFQVFFKKGSAGDEGRLAIAATLVYVGAWAACGIQFGRLVLGDGGASAGPPDHVVAQTSASAPVPSGPSLPPLSTGSFPPLDGK